MLKTFDTIPTYSTKVTIELRELIESGVDLWAFDYPSFYTGEEKKAFEQKVIDHYYFRQIGQETPARFLHYFRSRIREIMPYYIQLYESVELMKNAGDPFEAYNLTETFEQEQTGKASTSGTSSTESSGTSSLKSTFEATGSKEGTSDKKTLFSDTPQGELENVENGTYLTNATVEPSNYHDSTEENNERNDNGSTSDSSSGSSSQSSNDESTLKYTMTRRGNIGVQPLGQEINVYRSALINVDMQIINELNDLFLQIY